MSQGRPRRGSLTIVGTGYRAAAQITPEAIAFIEDADKLFHVLADPVTRMWLERLCPDAESLNDTYADGRPRRASYREMTARILAPVRRGLRVCAAFYGHPGVFVQASHAAVRQARAEGFTARMLPGVSAEDCLVADLGVDPAADGWQSFEATDFLLRRRRFDPRSALVLWQIGAIGVTVYRKEALWSRRGLEVLTEALLEHYPAAHEIVVYEASMTPICEPRIERLALARLPAAAVTIVSTLYVPPLSRAEIDPAMAERLGWPRSR